VNHWHKPEKEDRQTNTRQLQQGKVKMQILPKHRLEGAQMSTPHTQQRALPWLRGPQLANPKCQQHSLLMNCWLPGKSLRKNRITAAGIPHHPGRRQHAELAPAQHADMSNRQMS
jgi:hypothetical protein